MTALATSIIACLDHEALFAPHFRGRSWDAWRAFLAALFGLPLSSDQLGIWTACTGRTAAPSQPFKEAALICGRRGGKSRILALLATFIACFADHTPHLAAGEVATVAVISADRKQSRTVLRYITGLLRGTPALAALIEGETAETITLTNNVMIEVHTASFRVTRGYTLAAVLADEIAFWPPEESANPDVEIIRAVRPGLASLPHSLLLLASSPYAKRGVLWNTYRRHYGKDDARVLVWRGSTAQMNPTMDAAIIAEAYEDDPASSAAEFGAEFRDDISAFVSREAVDACVATDLRELPPASGIAYSAFVDPSGGSSDSMTLAIAHRDHDGVAILDAVREVRAPFSPEAVVSEFAGVLRSYGVGTVRGDRYAGEWPRERFQMHGIAYQPSEMPKGEIYLAFLPMLNSRRCQLLDHPRLVSQLCSLERRTARGGRDSIDHPPGGHDDIANAVGGVLVGFGTGAEGWVAWYRAETEKAKARLGSKFVHSGADRPDGAPLPSGDTAQRRALPDGAVGEGVMTFVASGPYAAFYVPAPDGHGRKFTADERGIIVAPATFRAALERAGCRIVNDVMAL